MTGIKIQKKPNIGEDFEKNATLHNAISNV